MKQILIIEDELDIQELLRTYLEDAGYGTTVAGVLDYRIPFTLCWSYHLWIYCMGRSQHLYCCDERRSRCAGGCIG